MASGKVYTVISNLSRSFKLGTSGDILGAITIDESTAVLGKIGAKPQMLPLSIHVRRYNDPTLRTYNCEIADNRLLTVQLAPAVIEVVALRVGELPPDHTIQYSASIGMDDGQFVRFSNVSTSMGLIEPLSEVAATLALLTNHPFEGAKVKSIDFDMQIQPKNIASHFWSVDVSKTKVRPGDEIDVDVVIESYLVEKREYRTTLSVPKDVAPGKYALMFLGVNEYEGFLRKSAPYKFVATSYQSLIDALNEVLNMGRTQLHCVLTLPPSGIALEREELPDLPASRAIVLDNDKRALSVVPYAHWVEKTIETGTVISDRESIPIVVEEPPH
jgi:hypothetical protein